MADDVMACRDHLPSIWSAALAAFLAEILNVTSLLVYQPENEDNQKKGQKRENIFQVAARVALVVIVMNLEKVTECSLVLLHMFHYAFFIFY